jgi:hypothetical protein
VGVGTGVSDVGIIIGSSGVGVGTGVSDVGIIIGSSGVGVGTGVSDIGISSKFIKGCNGLTG